MTIRELLKQAAETLAAKGIKTTDDLDRWRRENQVPDRFGRMDYGQSRYNALEFLVGEDAATWMLNELAINSLDDLPGDKEN